MCQIVTGRRTNKRSDATSCGLRVEAAAMAMPLTTIINDRVTARRQRSRAITKRSKYQSYGLCILYIVFMASLGYPGRCLRAYAPRELAKRDKHATAR